MGGKVIIYGLIGYIMKAIGILKPLPLDDPECFVETQIEKPVPENRNLLVKVMAISVNPVDAKRRAWKEDDGKLFILGWDVSGIVEEVGSECTIFKKGDEVYYSGNVSQQGANSEFHLVDERIVGRKPSTLSHAEAAALPLTSITAWEALFDRMKISLDPQENKGKSVLIIGAAGGVGSIASQLSSLAGLNVLGTAARPESIEWAKKHGVEHIIDRKTDFTKQLRELGLDYADYIFCLNSIEEHWFNMANAIAPLGRMCSIVGADGPIDLNALWTKSVSFSWEFMSTRPNFMTPDLIYQHEILNKLADLIDAGKIKSTISTRFSPINAQNLRKAHTQIETGLTIGKIVLESF